MPNNAKQALVISVLNIKGGVGKTTITANLFREMFVEKNINILLVDIDAQYNLTQLLMTRRDYESLYSDTLSKNKTVQSIFQHDIPNSVFAISEEYHLSIPPSSKLIFELEKNQGRDKFLHLLPGDFRLSTLNFRERAELTVPRKRFKSFIEQAKSEYDLVVLDCNPSTSFLTRCALEVSSNLLVPVRPDKFSIIGVEMLLGYTKMVLGTDMIPKINIIINHVGENEPDNVGDTLRRHNVLRNMVIYPDLRHSRHLKAQSDYTGFACNRGGPYINQIKGHLKDLVAAYSSALRL